MKKAIPLYCIVAVYLIFLIVYYSGYSGKNAIIVYTSHKEHNPSKEVTDNQVKSKETDM
jgi:hypothetical protein